MPREKRVLGTLVKRRKWPRWKCPTPLLAIALLLPLLLVTLSAQTVSLREKPCDFDCIHGRCDFLTRTCVCLPGWLGAGCDLCALGIACEPSKPQLALILPQAGPLPIMGQAQKDSPQFVYAHGSGLPRGHEAHYSCLFGSAHSSQGLWISSSLVRCPLPSSPPMGEPAKLAFSLVPAGSNAFVPYQEEWGTSHFTFFNQCQPDQCQGHCLGPLCLCPHSRAGIHCELANLTLNGTRAKLQQQLELNDSSLESGQEFRPYLAKLPIQQNQLARLSFHSDIDPGAGGGLQLDPFEAILYWPSPLGRSRPYSISVGIEPLEGPNQQLNWTLRVRPSYTAELDRTLALGNGTNAREVSGRVKWTGDRRAALNGSIPLLLHISARDANRSTPIEDIPIWTDLEDQKFRHLLHPYMGMAEKIAITVRHSGLDLEQHLHERDMHEETDPLEWTQEGVQVRNFPSELTASEHLLEANGSSLLALNYSLRLAPLDGDCLAGWRFEVVEPRALLAVDGHEMEPSNRQVQLQLRLLVGLEELTRQKDGGQNGGMPLRIAFICMPTGQSLIVRQMLKGWSNPGGHESSAAELSPMRLFIDLAQQPMAVHSLDILLPSGQSNQKLQRANLENANFAPFNLVWLSRPGPNAWRLWLALKSEELERGQNMDGALVIQGADNLALSVPYRVQQNRANAGQEPGESFLFTLTVKHSGGLQPFDSASARTGDWHADVELYSQAREQQFVRTLLLNTPDQFGPLQADLFQLRVKSRHFLPFSRLVRVDPLENAFIVQLQPRPAQYFAFDGHKFAAEWEEAAGGISQPTVQLRPAILPLHGPSPAQFVDVLYMDGPAQSFATVRPEWAQAGARRLSLPMATNASLCLGCGFRQAIRPLSGGTSMPSPECRALLVEVPFWAALPAGSSPAQLAFRQHFLLAEEGEEGEQGHGQKEEEQAKGQLPKLCQEGGDSSPPPPLGLRTGIPRDCALAHLRHCRALFRHPSGARCQAWWRQLPDDLLSIHSLAQFLLLSADCRREGGGPGQMLRLVQCIGHVDRHCPLHPLEAEMAPHVGGQLFNQIGYLKPFRSGLQSLFPALGLVESRLVNFPTLLADFLRQLNAVFPPHLMAPFDSAHFYDQFLAAIGSNSPNGTWLDWAELDAQLGDQRQSAHGLVERWNWLVQLLQGDRMDLLEQSSEANAGIELLRELVQSADRLKSVTRQFGADNPFAMFHEVLGHIFDNVAFRPDATNTTAEGDRLEQTIAWVDVRVEPQEAVEGEEFRVFANVQARQADLTGILLDLRFAQSPVKFRVGPVFTSGPDPLGSAVLRPGERLRVDWTVLPVPEFRLTGPVQQELELTLAFELSGQRRAQRLRVPSLLVRPRPSLRLLAFAHPTLGHGQAPAFSLLLSAINSGYSRLDKAHRQVT